MSKYWEVVAGNYNDKFKNSFGNKYSIDEAKSIYDNCVKENKYDFVCLYENEAVSTILCCNGES